MNCEFPIDYMPFLLSFCPYIIEIEIYCKLPIDSMPYLLSICPALIKIEMNCLSIVCQVPITVYIEVQIDFQLRRTALFLKLLSTVVCI